MSPPGRAILATKPLPTGSEICTNTIGQFLLFAASPSVWTGHDQHHIRLQGDQFFCKAAHPLQIAASPNQLPCDNSGRLPTELRNVARNAVMRAWPSGSASAKRRHQYADQPPSSGLCARAASCRRSNSRTTEKRDEIAPLHVPPGRTTPFATKSYQLTPTGTEADILRCGSHAPPCTSHMSASCAKSGHSCDTFSTSPTDV